MSDLFNPEERMSKEQIDKRNKERDKRTARILNDFKQLTDFKLKKDFIETLSQHDIMIMKDLVSIALVMKLKDMKIECREAEDLDILLQVIYNCYVNRNVTESIKEDTVSDGGGGSSNSIFKTAKLNTSDDELPSLSDSE